MKVAAGRAALYALLRKKRQVLCNATSTAGNAGIDW